MVEEHMKAERSENMFQRILVPLDGSARAENAIPVAALLARASAASLVIVRVALIPIESTRWRSPVVPADVIQHDIDEKLEEVKTYLEHVAVSSELAGLTVETQVLVGSNAAHCILAEVEWLHVDLLILSSHGNSGLASRILGSVAMDIVHHSPVPTLVLYEHGNALSNLSSVMAL